MEKKPDMAILNTSHKQIDNTHVWTSLIAIRFATI